MDAEGVFLVDQSGMLEMSYAGFDTEADLQELLARYPSLLAGRQIDQSSPRHWLLIAREKGVPAFEGGLARWSADHLFVDQDGIPTIVEVKRSTNTQIRREVVGQMLDYAANGIRYWPPEQLRADLVRRMEGDSDMADRQVVDLLERAGITDADVEEFWQKVADNLSVGKLRLLFVADEIPETLRRIIEFLNEQLVQCEVLGLEVRQFRSGTHRVLVPTVVGQTSQARTVKGSGKVDTFDELLEESAPAVRQVESALGTLAERRGWRISTSKAARQYRLATGPTLFQLNLGRGRGTVQMALGAVFDAGRSQEAEALRAGLTAMAGRVVTARNPWLDAQTILDHWDEWVGQWLPRYVSARSQVAAEAIPSPDSVEAQR
jgi:hypothetical protein